MDALTTVTDLTELFDFQNRIDAGGMGQTHLVRCKRDRGALRAGCDYVLKEVRADLVRDARAFEPTPPGGTVPSGDKPGVSPRPGSRARPTSGWRSTTRTSSRSTGTARCPRPTRVARPTCASAS